MVVLFFILDVLAQYSNEHRDKKIAQSRAAPLQNYELEERDLECIV